jgi:hypothetical protein
MTFVNAGMIKQAIKQNPEGLIHVYFVLLKRFISPDESVQVLRRHPYQVGATHLGLFKQQLFSGRYLTCTESVHLGIV